MNQQVHLERFLKETPNNQVLAITSNLRRLSNWAYDYPTPEKVKNIENFLEQTLFFTKALEIKDLSSAVLRRIKKFKKEFPQLAKRWQTSYDNHCRRLVWAEEILTWSNLLKP